MHLAPSLFAAGKTEGEKGERCNLFDLAMWSSLGQLAMARCLSYCLPAC